jgi:hypothetical protein
LAAVVEVAPGVALLAFISCALLAACASLGDAIPFAAEPPTPFGLSSSSPANSQTDVPIDTTIDLYFTTVPNPDSVQRDSVIVVSGAVRVDGRLGVDLVERRIRFVPAEELLPELSYEVGLAADLSDLGGNRLKASRVIGFRTGWRKEGPWPPPPPVEFSTVVAPLLAGRCAGATCHQGASSPLGLDLGSAEAALATLVEVRSRQQPSLLRVAAADHTRSYLMRKLLAVPGLVGEPMPRAGSPLAEADLRLLRDWIDQGASGSLP